MPARPVLESARLRLEPIGVEAVDAAHALLVDPAVRRYLCDGKVLARETVAGFIAEASATAGLGWWAVRRRDEADGQPIGIAVLHPASPQLAHILPQHAGAVEPTVALWPAAWGQGYAHEALTRLVAHAFGPLGYGHLVGTVDEPNAASRRMMARAGFRETGRAQGLAFPLVLYRLDRLDPPGEPSPG